MTKSNDQQVAEILARGIARIRALGVAKDASASGESSEVRDPANEKNSRPNPPRKDEVSR